MVAGASQTKCVDEINDNVEMRIKKGIDTLATSATDAFSYTNAL